MAIYLFKHEILLLVQDGSKLFLYLAIQYLCINVFLLLDYFVDLATPGFVLAVEVF